MASTHAKIVAQCEKDLIKIPLSIAKCDARRKRFVTAHDKQVDALKALDIKRSLMCEKIFVLRTKVEAIDDQIESLDLRQTNTLQLRDSCDFRDLEDAEVSKPKKAKAKKAKKPEEIPEVDIPDEELMSRIGLKMQIPLNLKDTTTSKVVVTNKGLLELSRGSVTWPAFKETQHLWSSITEWQRDCRSEGSVVELLN